MAAVAGLAAMVVVVPLAHAAEIEGPAPDSAAGEVDIPTVHAAKADVSSEAAVPQTAPAVKQAKPEIVDRNPRPLGTARSALPLKKGAAAEAKATSGTAETLPSAGWWNNPILRTLASLGTVLTIIGALAVGARKLKAKGFLHAGHASGGGAPSGILEVLGRYPIARGQMLLLLKIDQRVLLIGQTLPKLRGGAGSMQTLCEISSPEEVASILIKAQDSAGASASAKFQAMLQDFDARHVGDDDHVRDAERLGAAAEVREAARQAAATRSESRESQSGNIKFPHVDPLADTRVTERRRVPADSDAARASAHGHVQPTGGDSYNQIRDRLSALRGEAHR